MIDQTPAARQALAAIWRTGLPGVSFDPKQVVRMLNRRFPETPPSLHLFYATLDTETAGVTWIRAGHVPPLLVKRTARVRNISGPGAICISNLHYEENGLQTQRLILEPGDRLYLFSDGIVEAMRGDRIRFRATAEIMRGAITDPLEATLKTAFQSYRVDGRGSLRRRRHSWP